MLSLLLLAACGGDAVSAPAPTPSPSVPPEALRTQWVERSDVELDAALKAACERASARDALVLLEFSAEWCIDCKVVSRMKPTLARELANWEWVTANVGRFDRHAALREAFAVGGIVTWVALEPSDCSAPVPAWPRKRAGLLEPASGSGPKTPRDLEAWLREARGA